MELKNNRIVLIAIGIIIAYLMLVYLPKQEELKLRQQENALIQQETSLRKQTYEICLKEFDKLYDDSSDMFRYVFAKQVIAGTITEQEMNQKLFNALTPILNSKDTLITKCVEKRLQEYKK